MGFEPGEDSRMEQVVDIARERSATVLLRLVLPLAIMLLPFPGGYWVQSVSLRYCDSAVSLEQVSSFLRSAQLGVENPGVIGSMEGHDFRPETAHDSRECGRTRTCISYC